MVKHYVEHAIVVALGFVMGAVLALNMTSGDTLVVLMSGIVVGFCADALFDRNFGGEWSWPLGRPVLAKHSTSKPRRSPR